jgi:hypothetical protein
VLFSFLSSIIIFLGEYSTKIWRIIVERQIINCAFKDLPKTRQKGGQMLYFLFFWQKARVLRIQVML